MSRKIHAVGGQETGDEARMKLMSKRKRKKERGRKKKKRQKIDWKIKRRKEAYL